MALKTLQEQIEGFQIEVQNAAPELTDFTEGSNLDSLSGAVAFLASEASRLVLDEFAKTFFDSAAGPEETGGADDLQTLAVDHFGADFARPGASKSSGTVTFSRTVITAGNVVIPPGTIVKTKKNADGTEYTFETSEPATMTGLTLSVSVQASAAGTSHNVTAGAVTIVESSLTDPTVTVSNPQPIGGGGDTYTDAQYREFIRLKITGFRLSVLESVEASARTVPGIVYATGTERWMPVIEFDIATGQPKAGAVFFRIPYATLYVASSGGTASTEQIKLVREAINNVRSYGVGVRVISAVASTLDWSVTVTLNSGGPNYAAFFNNDFTLITDSMAEYLAALPIGSGFDKTAANAAIFAIWGDAGTNDLLTMSTTVPGASIAPVTGQKLIAGTLGVG